MKMEEQFKKKFDMDYDGMGDQGRFPAIKERTKEFNSIKIFLIFAIVFFSLIILGFTINN